MSRAAFALVAVSLVLSLTVSANLLYVAGIDYAHPGGNPLIKLHPATWAIAAALVCLCLSTPDPVRAGARMLGRDRGLAAFLALMTATMVFSAVSVGVSGASVYVESYLSAGLLALAMRQLTPLRRRTLGLLVLGLLAANAALSVVETLAQFHLVPIYLEERSLVDEPGAFRSAALFDHPLSGAMLTTVGLFAAFAFGLRPRTLWPLLALFGTALLAFGGRAALGVTAILGLAAVARTVLADLIGRRRLGRAAMLSAAALLLPAAAVAVAVATGIGGRLAGKLYLDSSAQSRGSEWMVLGLLDLRAWLFGSPIGDTPALIYQVGLQSALTDIENCWLMAFINLGIIGFVMFAAAVAFLLRHLWQIAPPFGRLAIVALMLTASTSNSLGRKSNVLFTLAACIEAVGRPVARVRMPLGLGTALPA